MGRVGNKGNDINWDTSSVSSPATVLNHCREVNKSQSQDFCWKVHDRAQSLLLPLYTMHELRNQRVSIG